MNYYEILNCEKTSTLEEIKGNYQRLVKLNHPDKRNSNDSNEDYIAIDKAWKTLRDEKLRREYDASLLQKDFNQQPLIYAEISIENLQFDENLEAYYPCRCGEFYIINKGDFGPDEESVMECSECSNFGITGELLREVGD